MKGDSTGYGFFQHLIYSDGKTPQTAKYVSPTVENLFINRWRNCSRDDGCGDFTNSSTAAKHQGAITRNDRFARESNDSIGHGLGKFGERRGADFPSWSSVKCLTTRKLGGGL